MIFYWLKSEKIEELELPIGSRLKGIHRKNKRPAYCSLDPSEVLAYLEYHGGNRLAVYLHTVKKALRK